MEKLGGLIRPMPVTAFCFLIGAVAISRPSPIGMDFRQWEADVPEPPWLDLARPKA